MSAFLPAILIFVVAYLLGSIPFGLIVARSQGIDIRAHGSGNIGATNVWRTLGKKWGLLTFFCDAAKGWLAVVCAFLVAGHFPNAFRDQTFAGIIGAVGCILGHNFPVWLSFKGGKGVATSLGVIIGMMPLASLIVFALWGVIFKTTRYVSLASIVAALLLPVVVLALLSIGQIHGWGNFYFACAAGILVIWRHRPNISRLINGTESRFGSSHPKP
jgi:acyl phosphate:glycerol-3-phosphate acyltransferase